MAKREHVGYGWVAAPRDERSRHRLDAGYWFCHTKRELEEALSEILAPNDWVPVRVRITPIAGKKKGTVKR
jgi:hypothetical protein